MFHNQPQSQFTLAVLALASTLGAASFSMCAQGSGGQDVGTPPEVAATHMKGNGESETQMGAVTSKDGTKIAFEQRGNGPALILVSSALSDRTDTRRLAGLLSKNLTVINYDRRGRGDSGDTKPYAVEREIQDIEALIDKAGGSAFLFGHSSGAVLALETANRLPTKVKMLAIFEPPFVVDDSHPPFPADFVSRVTELVATGKRGEAVEYFMTQAIGVPPEMVAGMKSSPMWPGMEKRAHTIAYDGTIMSGLQAGLPLPKDRWTAVKASTLIMDGGESDTFLHSAANALAAVLPGAQRLTLAGQDHSVVFTNPAAIAPALLEFFQSNSDGQSSLDKSGDLTQAKQGYADVNGLRMYYEIHGMGKPLVLLHGAFGWATDYPLLSKNRQVIAVELQGHGHTADIDRPLTFEQMADDTAALLKHLKIERADFFGYSMGGVVALAIAIRHPDLVDKVAINGSHFGRLEDAYEPEAFSQIKSLPPDFAPEVLKEPYDKVAPDPKQWPALVAKIKKMELEFKGFAREDMKSIKAPVLITLGDRDGMRPEHAVEMFRLIPNAQLAIFPGGDHLLLWMSPETVLTPIAAFLNAPQSQTK